MAFLNEEAFFEKRGDRYVFRPSPFSAGYDVSKEEKNKLVAGLKRIDQRSLIEALGALALIASLFLAGVVRSETPVGWILAFFTLALVVVTWRSLQQRNGPIKQALGNRAPDIRRLPFWTALWRSRPLVANRVAVPVLRVVIVLLLLFLAANNVLAFMPVLAALHSRAVADAAAKHAEVAEILSRTLHNEAFWMALLLFNLVVIVAIVGLGIELRHRRPRRNPV
jgi:hypothetical protein